MRENERRSIPMFDTTVWSWPLVRVSVPFFVIEVNATVDYSPRPFADGTPRIETRDPCPGIESAGALDRSIGIQQTGTPANARQELS